MFYLYLFIAFAAIFSVSFLFYTYGTDFITERVGEKYKDYMAFPLILLFSVAMGTASFLWKGTALSEPDVYDILIMGCGAALISAYGIFSKNRWGLFFIILTAVTCCLFWEQHQDTLVYNRFPLIYGQVALGAGWFLLSAIYPIFSRVNGILGAYTITILIGVLIFYLSGGVSPFELFAALFLAAALIPYAVYNIYPSKIDMSEAGAASVGFVLGWILQRCCAEGMSLPTEILLSWVWVEAVLGILNFIFQKEEYRTTLWVQNIDNEENCRRVMKFCIKIQPVMIFLAVMQMHVLIALALPIFAVLVVLWGMGKFAVSDGKSFSEVNSEIAASVKNEYKEFMDIWRKLKK